MWWIFFLACAPAPMAPHDAAPLVDTGEAEPPAPPAPPAPPPAPPAPEPEPTPGPEAPEGVAP
jgi:hypothetical protein